MLSTKHARLVSKILGLILIAAFSFFFLTAKLPETEFIKDSVESVEKSSDTVMKFSAATLSTSLAISALPDDFATPLAESLSDMNIYFVAILVVLFTGIMVFKGIRQVTKVTDKMVPVMAVLYVITVLLLIILNIGRIPYFFGAVFGGAFTSEAVFGGVFGTILAQGIKRGLMSNEAGQGTITMAAGAASCDHPCDQGIVQSIGVFLDTIVICTLTGFVVVMAHVWSGAGSDAWFAMDRLPKFLASAAELTPGTAMNAVVTFLITFCFCLFAYTCLIGMISFSEIAANRISRKKSFLNGIRIIGLFIASFGILCSIAGLDLGNLWAISDLGNILIVFANVPLLYLGARYVFKATKHYKTKDAGKFDSSVIGTECEYWDERK